MQIFEYSKKFPIEEKYSLTDQVRRSSRSVCANLAEAWRKRRYKAAFVAKLNDCEAEAAETQVWLKFAVKCQYLTVEQGRELYSTYSKLESNAPQIKSYINDSASFCNLFCGRFALKLLYNQVLSGLVKMITHPDNWLLG